MRITMYELTVESHFDAAHFLAGHPGKCRNIHGHRWKVILAVAAENVDAEGPARGMVMDFADMKKALKDITGELDHTLIIEEGSLRPSTVAALQDEGMALQIMAFRPTAENLARYIFDKVTAAGVPAAAVTVCESPCSTAAYRA